MDKKIYLCSYPRSGNTWTRLLLSDIFMQCSGLSTDSENVLIASDEIIPDMHLVDLQNHTCSLSLPFQIIKTHNSFEEGYQSFIFLVRNPIDALCSFFHYNFGINKLNDDVSIDSFVIQEADGWIKHTNSFLQAYQSTDSIIMTYESLHKNPVQTLYKILEFLKYKAETHVIQKAIENHSFSKHKGKWKLKQAGDKGGAFFRKGKVGSGIDELDAKTVAYIQNRCFDVYQNVQNLE